MPPTWTARRPLWCRRGRAKTYGTFSIDAAGAWTYTLNNANARSQALNTSSTPLHERSRWRRLTAPAGHRHHHQRRQRRGGDHRDGDGSVLERAAIERHGWRCDRVRRLSMPPTWTARRPLWCRPTCRPRLWHVLDRCRGRVDLHAQQRQRRGSGAQHVERAAARLVTVATADGTEQVIDITINGANDAAVITGTATAR